MIRRLGRAAENEAGQLHRQGMTETKQTGALERRQQLQHFALDEESGFDQLAQPLPQFCAPIRLDRVGPIRYEAAGAFPFE
jgi:hypothetical protein